MNAMNEEIVFAVKSGIHVKRNSGCQTFFSTSHMLSRNKLEYLFVLSQVQYSRVGTKLTLITHSGYAPGTSVHSA